MVKSSRHIANPKSNNVRAKIFKGGEAPLRASFVEKQVLEGSKVVYCGYANGV